MPPTLDQLEREKRGLLQAMSRLGDLRPGSISGMVRRCGKPVCHCAKRGDRGHGPNLRLTYKVDGRTISQALPTHGLVRKARREIAQFRRFQQLARLFVQVSERICRLRPDQPQRSDKLVHRAKK